VAITYCREFYAFHSFCFFYFRKFHDVLNEHIFASTASSTDGFDLAALNIQRGRDHGIKDYIAYYNHFANNDPNKSPINNFADIPNTLMNFNTLMNVQLSRTL
jgi:hypothetical protein